LLGLRKSRQLDAIPVESSWSTPANDDEVVAERTVVDA
jgi:hypothetical protein